MLDPKEAFKRIRRVQISALRHVNDLFAGNYRSVFKGRGLEFEEVREYQPGDDIRLIDWNVTARSGNPFVKNFREERELTVILAIDISASSHFGHIRQTKSEMVAEIAAILAFSAIKNHDNVGLLLFTDQVELYLKPKKGVRHVLRVIREILYFEPKHKRTDLAVAFAFLAKVQRRPAICFLISDFLGNNFSKQANILAKRHELIAFHVLDPYERSFKPKGLFSLRDLETGDIALIDTSNTKTRQRFEELSKEREKNVRKLFLGLGTSYFAMHTGESSQNILQRFFYLRNKNL